MYRYEWWILYMYFIMFVEEIPTGEFFVDFTVFTPTTLTLQWNRADRALQC